MDYHSLVERIGVIHTLAATCLVVRVTEHSMVAAAIASFVVGLDPVDTAVGKRVVPLVAWASHLEVLTFVVVAKVASLVAVRGPFLYFLDIY